jgi:hypothetical protein
MKLVIVLFLLNIFMSVAGQKFLHPGVLHKESDFARMREKVAKEEEPWYSAWKNLLNSVEAGLNWGIHVKETIIRGGDGDNVGSLYRDVAAIYQSALIYKINGDTKHGDKAVELLNAWSSGHKTVSGNADRYLAAGLFGYQMANAAEMMRDYTGFKVDQFKDYLKNVYYKPLNERFIYGNDEYGAPNNDACCTNYRGNWQTCNLAAMAAIGIFNDEREWFNKAVDYYYNGCGNAQYTRAVNYIHAGTNGEPDLGQWEESGRDQGHTAGGFTEMGLYMEMAWNQGVDLFGYNDSRIRKASEYISKYNIYDDAKNDWKYTVPFTSYTHGQGSNCSPYTESTVSASGRGARAPYLAQMYNHFAHRAGATVAQVKYTKERLAEAPGGNIDGPSINIHPDTYDNPGFGSLTYTLDSGIY